ncbi:MAG: aldo/keto reductase [Betaproteobacteria bacterium]|nr:aldo/keto reductase [Betaproteobacteria bacterium]
MRKVILPSGVAVPAFGMGTWEMGNRASARSEELATLRLGLELGATLIDTAEMYGEGLAEELVGEAIAGRRDEAFLVSKVYPHNATRRGAIAACERSLHRLRTDRLDLYLLHWRGEVPLAETFEAFDELQRAGKIRHYGVSNFDVGDMREAMALRRGQAVQTNQVLYNLTRRGIEWALLPWQRERRIPVMAYSPIEQGRLPGKRRLVAFARDCGMTPAQVALAWLLAKLDVIVIPKTSSRLRLKENLGALEHALSEEQLIELDRMFPPPGGPGPLEML